MLKDLVLMVATFWSSPLTSPAPGPQIYQVQAQEILIFGGADHKDFLGCLNCSKYDDKSIANRYSDYGWENLYGKWSRYGDYASPYSSTSACAPYASDAPVLVDGQGNFYGRLSVNEYADGSICGVQGNDQICSALQQMCSGD